MNVSFSNPFFGLLAAPFTPMNNDGTALNVSAVQKQMSYMLDCGLNGAFVEFPFAILLIGSLFVVTAAWGGSGCVLCCRFAALRERA